MGQSMVHSNLVRCHRTLCYKMIALEGLTTIVIDLNKYTVRKSIPDVDRGVEECSANGVGS